MVNETHRECTCCGEYFEKWTQKKQGHRCKQCAISIAHKKSSSITRMWQGAKQRAKKKGIAFDITKEDIVIPETCPILGISIVFGAKGNPRRHSPSLDRKDNSIGYTKDNIQVISNLANSMKNAGTPEDLLKFADWITSVYQSGNS